MLLGGVLVYQGRASLGIMLVAGCAGAIIGDSIGYEIGRKFGHKLRNGRLGRKVGRQRWDHALEYVKRRGGRAVFFGRFVGVLRALVPAVAGSAGMPYRSFLLFNVAGGIIWASGFILLGLAAGGSYALVERWAGRASLLLLLILAVALAIGVAARWVRDHLGDLRRARDTFLERPPVVRLRRRYRTQIDFLERRFDSSQRFGLYVTVGLILAVAGATLLGVVVEDVLGREELALMDRPVLRFLMLHRAPALTDVMKVLTMLGSTGSVVGVLGLAAIGSYFRTRQGRWPLFLLVTTVGAVGLDNVIKLLVQRPRPELHPLVRAAGSSFPSGHATAAAALCGGLAYLLTRHRSWKTSVRIWAIGVFASLLIGFSRVYLGVHWPTDVLAGLLLGGFWTAVTATATNAWAPLHPSATRSG